MNKKELIMACLLFGLGISLYSQKLGKSYDAYFINLNNDTIYGKMRDIANSLTSLEYINFWSESGQKLTYKADEIKSLYTQDRKFEQVLLRDINGDLTKKNVLFDRVINGPMILYMYSVLKPSYNILTNDLSSKCFNYYYVKKLEDTAAFFAYRENCEYSIFQLNLMKKDISGIGDYFNEIPEISEKIISGEYKHQDLFIIVNEYNELIGNKNKN
jgi:hypothetical protein